MKNAKRIIFLISIILIAAIIIGKIIRNELSNISYNATKNNGNELNISFFNAAVNSDFEQVINLVEKGADVNFCIKNNKISGITVLMLATKWGDLDAVKFLIDHGANVNAVNDGSSTTALLLAAEAGYSDIVKYLINNGAEINFFISANGTTALMLASEKGHIDIVKYLVDKGADANSANTVNGTTALMLASEKGHLDLVKYLIEKGADVNSANTVNGTTALMLASKQGHIDIVKYLIEKDADINFVNTINKNTALTLASREGNYELIKYLIANGADVSNADYFLILEVIYHRDRELAELLINKDVNISIHLAAYAGFTDIVQNMLASGININEKEEYTDNTPLYKAIEGFNLETVKLLLDNNANVNAANYLGDTPLKKAVELGFTDIARCLIEKGANINISDNDGYGETLLHIAAHSGHKDIVELLLKSGVDAAKTNNAGDTALDIALRSNFTEIIKLLGGDINNSSLTKKEPFTEIISDQNDASEFIRWQGYDFDNIWIPEKEDIEGFEQILKKELTENLSIRTISGYDREYIISNLRRYSLLYSGYILDNQKYLFCQLIIFSEDYDYEKKAEQFYMVLDGGPSYAYATFNFEKKSVETISCNGM